MSTMYIHSIIRAIFTIIIAYYMNCTIHIIYISLLGWSSCILLVFHAHIPRLSQNSKKITLFKNAQTVFWLAYYPLRISCLTLNVTVTKMALYLAINFGVTLLAHLVLLGTEKSIDKVKIGMKVLYCVKPFRLVIKKYIRYL